MNAWRSGEMLEVPMSEQLARAYEGFRAAGTAPAVPRLAATVMLVRSPREVFMLRRAATMAFVPEAVVFPTRRFGRVAWAPAPTWRAAW